MIATRKYKLNLTPGKGIPPIVHVSQYDSEALTITFELYEDGTLFPKSGGATAKIEMTKPDRKAISGDCTYAADGTVSFTVTEQMTAKEGTTRGKIIILDSAGGQIGTAAFLMEVDAAGIADGAIESESDLPELREVMKAVNETAQKAKDAATSAEAASSSAQKAAESETNAKKSQTAAADSEGTAKKGAETAVSKAKEASESASAALQAQKDTEQLKADAGASAAEAGKSEEKAGEYKTAAEAAAQSAAGYAGEAEYRIGLNPATGRPAIYHYTN